MLALPSCDKMTALQALQRTAFPTLAVKFSFWERFKQKQKQRPEPLPYAKFCTKYFYTLTHLRWGLLSQIYR